MILAFPEKTGRLAGFFMIVRGFAQRAAIDPDHARKRGAVNRDGDRVATLDEPTASPDSASRDMVIGLMNDAKFRGAAADMEPHIESLRENA